MDEFIAGVEEKRSEPRGKAAGFKSSVAEVTASEATAVRRGQRRVESAAREKNYTIRDVPVEWIARIEQIADELGLSKKDAGHALLYLALRAYDAGERPVVQARPRAMNVFVPETR
jgi:hypothetical protein